MIVGERRDCKGGNSTGRGGATSPTPLFAPAMFRGRSRNLFRTLHRLHGGLTSRLTVPTCVILSSGALRLLTLGGPNSVRTFNRVDKVNRFGGRGCKGSFLTIVGRCLNEGW